MVEIRHVPERTRYQVVVDGEVAGYVHYKVVDGAVIFDHTLIDERYSGQGLAARLVRGALDDVRAHGGRIVAVCPYVAGWLAKHPEHADLVDRDLADRLGAAG